VGEDEILAQPLSDADQIAVQERLAILAASARQPNSKLFLRDESRGSSI
jgi:hypothetical protein